MHSTTGKVDNIELLKSGPIHWRFRLCVDEVLLEQMVYGSASVIIRGSEYLLSSCCSPFIVFVYNRPSVRGLDGFDSTFWLLHSFSSFLFFPLMSGLV